MRTALLALLCLGPAVASAQTGVETASRSLEEAAVGACPGLEAGAFAVRIAVDLADEAPDASGLVPAILGPTLEALRADPRFPTVHVASFGRDGVTPAELAHDLGYEALLDLVVRRDHSVLVLEGATWRTRDATQLDTFSLRVALDHSLRRFVGFPALLADDSVNPRSVRLPGNHYVALALGDLDSDGRPEIVASRPGEVHVFRLAGRRVTLVGRAPIPTTVPRSPSPPRRTVGSARAVGDRVLLRISEYTVGLVVRLVEGTPTVEVADGPCEADRFPMMGGCARLVTGRDFFDRELTHHAAPAEAAPAHFYMYAFGRYHGRDGEPTTYEAIVMPSGRLSVRVRREPMSDGGDTEIVERAAAAVGYGTALAMGDLDLDGTAELLVSHAAPEGGGDQLSLVRALPRGALRVMWRSEPMAGSVWVAAAGDADGDGSPELVAIEEPASGRGRATLWIVR